MEFDVNLVARSIRKARGVVRSFGSSAITTLDRTRLLSNAEVCTQIADLPDRYAAVMVPGIRGRRLLLIGSHVPRVARHLVMLHEAGHRFQNTDKFGVAYDNEDWHNPRELAADAFAAVALFPTFVIDSLLAESVWIRDVEDAIAEELQFLSGDIFPFERALDAARNRLIVRERVSI